MKITKITIRRIAIPFTAGVRHIAPVKEEDKFNGASPNIDKMESLLVEVETDTGLIGWGEAFGHASNVVTYAALEHLVAPMFVGKHIAEYEQHLYAAKRALHSFGSSGPMLYALSAIDIAIWDLKAQQAKQPLHQFLGGKSGKISLYASLVSYGNEPEKVRENVLRTAKAGFKKIKLHETTYDAVAAARHALPDDVELMVDVNCPWNLAEATAKVTELKPLNLGWVEEPVWPPEDTAQLASIRKIGVPISAGENASGPDGFEQLFKAGAIDIAQPSVSKIGGITGMYDVCDRAKHHNVKVVPHCFYYGAGMIATAHFIAANMPETSLEIPFIELADFLHPLNECPATYDLGNTFGLGFSPKPEIIEKYTIASCLISNK
ncbi:mandelate racemase/muconate lactonizing enzyme family protein [Marinomonas sp. FW-1]|uniref:mandelate racemase/muconate lactonizing enzyme family protein n=1 Tax=Marinomonas sp. FW-1 TaxID=2071621 RepID=UPI0010C0AB04|nr:mandelate racemase/muconate lactonizing enzyme family protein [Marinomonas sp. FW-1]